MTPTTIEFLLDLDINTDTLFGRLNNIGLHAIDGMPLPSWFEAIQLDFGVVDEPATAVGSPSSLTDYIDEVVRPALQRAATPNGPWAAETP